MFQFAVLMWLLTYVGALFNGLTLLIMGKAAPPTLTKHSHHFQGLGVGPP